MFSTKLDQFYQMALSVWSQKICSLSKISHSAILKRSKKFFINAVSPPDKLVVFQHQIVKCFGKGALVNVSGFYVFFVDVYFPPKGVPLHAHEKNGANSEIMVFLIHPGFSKNSSSFD